MIRIFMAKIIILIGVCLLFVGLRLCFAQRNIKIEISSKNVNRYEKAEFILDVDAVYSNPFSPADVDLSMEFKSPNGKKIIIPAFYYQNFERKYIDRAGKKTEWLYPVGGPVWKARFAPMEVGTYSCKAKLRDRSGTAESDTVSFECIPSQKHGYLRVSLSDPRFLEFSDGTPFFVIGQDIAFVKDDTYKVTEMLAKMANNGANFVRIWASCNDWAMSLEGMKSAWMHGKTIEMHIVPKPKAKDGLSDDKCVEISGEKGAIVSISPTHKGGRRIMRALRPNCRYQVSMQVTADTDTQLSLNINGRKAGEVTVNPANWVNFKCEFTTSMQENWLEKMSLRLESKGTAWISSLSMKEAAGGPELLEEADVNRSITGNYNQLDSFMLDRVVEAAQDNGIYLQLCLFTKNFYVPLLKSANRIDYDTAIKNAEQLLRYVIARWGYSANIAVFEYLNETSPNLAIDRFCTEVGDYLEQTDSYRHLRASSPSFPGPNYWRQPKLDTADLHWYLRPGWGKVKEMPIWEQKRWYINDDWAYIWKDEVAAVLDRAKFLRGQAPGKPALLSEFGLATDDWKKSPYMEQDEEFLHFHNMLWASALSGLSGTTLFWWSDELDRKDAYHHYQPLAAFLADIPFTTAKLHDILAAASSPNCHLIGLQGKNSAYLWISNSQATWWKMLVEKTVPGEIKGAFVDIRGMEPGAYQIQWYDTYSAKIIKQEQIQSSESLVHLIIPDFSRDIACKIRKPKI